jgi:hypothetical protein
MTITEHRCMADDANLSILSACHPALLNEALSDPDEQKATLLAAWTVLLRDYYAPNDPAFVHIEVLKRELLNKNTGIYPDNLHCKHVSVQIDDSNATIEQLKKKTSQAVQAGAWAGLTAYKDKTAAVILPKEQIKRPAQLLELLEV